MVSAHSGHPTTQDPYPRFPPNPPLGLLPLTRVARAELDRRLDAVRVALGKELGRRLSADEQYYSVHGPGAYLGLHMDEVSLSAEFPSIRVDMHAINAASSRTHR